MGWGSPPGTTGDAGDRDMGERLWVGWGSRLGRQAMRAIGVWDRIGFTDERSVGCTGGTRVWSKPSVRRRDGFGDVLNK